MGIEIGEEVMLDTACSEVVWRVLTTHCIRQFPLHLPLRRSPCAITFQLESTWIRMHTTLNTNPKTCRSCLINYSMLRISVIRSDKELFKPLYLWDKSRGCHGQEQWRTEEFCWGVQEIQLRTEDRENGDLVAVAPWSKVLEAAVIGNQKFDFV